VTENKMRPDKVTLWPTQTLEVTVEDENHLVSQIKATFDKNSEGTVVESSRSE
jgi:hypothetical protein